MEKYFNYKMCKMCGGACCRSYAGSYKPEDFTQQITTDFILQLLDSGKVAIDWWEGDVLGKDLSQTYYLRPRHKNEPAIKGSWGGECVNWSKEHGCSLSEDERPYQCRMLIPNFNNGMVNCDHLDKDKAGKDHCAIAWYDYQEIFDEVTKQYFNKAIH